MRNYLQCKYDYKNISAIIELLPWQPKSNDSDITLYTKVCNCKCTMKI